MSTPLEDVRFTFNRARKRYAQYEAWNKCQQLNSSCLKIDESNIEAEPNFKTKFDFVDDFLFKFDSVNWSVKGKSLIVIAYPSEC